LSESNKNLKFQVLKSNRENESHLETIKNLRLKMGTLDHQISSASTNPEAFSDNLIELKKELKVLRRERDHYKEIIKKNKLL
jgi:chromosome segregation ATPase